MFFVFSNAVYKNQSAKNHPPRPAAAPSTQPSWRTANRTGLPKRSRSARISRVKAFPSDTTRPRTATAVEKSALAETVPPPIRLPIATAMTATKTAVSSDESAIVRMLWSVRGVCAETATVGYLFYVYPFNSRS